jgi:hypothetical protein
VGDAVRERASLARAGAGDDEQRRRRSRRLPAATPKTTGAPSRLLLSSRESRWATYYGACSWTDRTLVDAGTCRLSVHLDADLGDFPAQDWIAGDVQFRETAPRKILLTLPLVISNINPP